ncbi:MAG TPA: hypothetical protein VG675_21605, partial [Bryobacteraceae bacterium]|nr:hypothetical protein [Bryobacteraceae bacterium]
IQVDRFDRRFWDFSGSLHILSLKQTETFSAPNVLNSRDFFTDPPGSAFRMSPIPTHEPSGVFQPALGLMR